LRVAWEASGRACGKRLKAELHGLVAALIADGRLKPDPLVRSQLLSISAATIDRVLASSRRATSIGQFEEKCRAVLDALGDLEQLLASDSLSPEERLLAGEQHRRGTEQLLHRLETTMPRPEPPTHR
jgi:hypothetical protein